MKGIMMRKKEMITQKKTLRKEKAEGPVSGADAIACMALTIMAQ